MSMNKPWKVGLVFVGVFLAGVLCGGPLVVRWQNYQNENRPPFIERTLARYERDLGITAAQKEKIRPILLSIQKEWRQLRQNNVRQLQAVVDRMHDGVAAELTPEQHAKLEEMRKETHQRTELLRGRQHDREERQDRRKQP